jgi:dTDP-4-amino-4,6-dideoxygalactose transaminase
LVLRDHGRTAKTSRPSTTEVAYKYHEQLEAAFGLAQLERRKHHESARSSLLRGRLSGIQGITRNVEPAGTFNTF